MSVHIAEVMQIFVCIVAGVPVMRTPLQILFLILVTDLPPSIALGMEPGEPGILKLRLDAILFLPRSFKTASGCSFSLPVSLSCLFSIQATTTQDGAHCALAMQEAMLGFKVLGWMWFAMVLNGAVLSLVIAPRLLCT